MKNLDNKTSSLKSAVVRLEQDKATIDTILRITTSWEGSLRIELGQKNIEVTKLQWTTLLI